MTVQLSTKRNRRIPLLLFRQQLQLYKIQRNADSEENNILSKNIARSHLTMEFCKLVLHKQKEQMKPHDG